MLLKHPPTFLNTLIFLLNIRTEKDTGWEKAVDRRNSPLKKYPPHPTSGNRHHGHHRHPTLPPRYPKVFLD